MVSVLLSPLTAKVMPSGRVETLHVHALSEVMTTEVIAVPRFTLAEAGVLSTGLFGLTVRTRPVDVPVRVWLSVAIADTV